MVATQLPLWWGYDSADPECLFSNVPSAGCNIKDHVLSIKTPTSQGLDYCDLPFSSKFVKMPPIPGKYPMRVLTFNNGGKWYPEKQNEWATPLEQDTYIMDIPSGSIAALTVWTSSSQKNDPDAIIHVKGNIHPFKFPAQGAIMLSFPHIESSSLDRSSWPWKLGHTDVGDNSFLSKPCKVYTNDETTGVYTGDREVGEFSSYDFLPSVRCYLFTGNTAVMNNTIISIIGWDTHKNIGDYMDIVIPGIKYCDTKDRQCKVTVRYTATQDFLNPYITNEREFDLGKVRSPIALVQPAMTGSSGFVLLSNAEKCADNNLDIYVDLPQNLITGDYIQITRKLSHWYFFSTKFYVFEYPDGGNSNIKPVINKENDQEIWVIQ